MGAVAGLGLVAVLAVPRLRASPAPALTALVVKGIPPIPLVWPGASIDTALSGMAAAHLLAHRINPVHARRAVTTLAALATLFTVIHGIPRKQCPWIRNG